MQGRELTQTKLKLPNKLEPVVRRSSLLASVRPFIYQLYNAANEVFKSLFLSTCAEDSVTGNRMFDRARAVGMVKDAAEKSGVSIVTNAQDYDIYRCIVYVLRRDHGISQRLRYAEYKRLTAPIATPAE